LPNPVILWAKVTSNDHELRIATGLESCINIK
jgi:hypothetical protein